MARRASRGVKSSCNSRASCATFVLVRGQDATAQALGFVLGMPPARSLDDQCHQKGRLQQQRRGAHHDGPSVLLPQRRLAEEDRTSIRQVALPDLPSFQLAPVIRRLCEFQTDNRRLGAAFVGQHGAGQFCRLRRRRRFRHQRPPDDALAELAAEKAEDRRRSSRTDTGQRNVVVLRDASAVDVHLGEEDRRIRAKAGDAFLDVAEGQLVQVFDPHALAEGLRPLAHDIHPEALDRRIAAHYGDGRRRGQHLKDIGEQAGNVQGDHRRRHHAARVRCPA